MAERSSYRHPKGNVNTNGTMARDAFWMEGAEKSLLIFMARVKREMRRRHQLKTFRMTRGKSAVRRRNAPAESHSGFKRGEQEPPLVAESWRYGSS